jgi:hypothetical protein
VVDRGAVVVVVEEAVVELVVDDVPALRLPELGSLLVLGGLASLDDLDAIKNAPTAAMTATKMTPSTAAMVRPTPPRGGYRSSGGGKMAGAGAATDACGDAAVDAPTGPPAAAH